MLKECPMCGEPMTLVERELVDRIPGSAQTTRRQAREWTCGECEHFEEADSEEMDSDAEG